MAKAKKTIYRVEGGLPGESSPEPGSLLPDLMEPAPAGSRERTSDTRLYRRRLFWVVVGVAILTIVMIVAIAVLGASESPAVVASIDASTSSSLAAVVATTEPVSTPTTAAPPPSSTSSSSTSSSSTATTYPVHTVAEPGRLVIPILGVDATIVPVGLKDGSEMVIPDVGVVGWYKLGPLPGAAGPSVLVSHVSYSGTKGAFYKLKEMKPGDQFQVYSPSGDYALFQVDSLETILKGSLPTERIWNQTDESVIRLVTCGGNHDSKSGHYLSGIIVYAHLVK